jgi:hypothetical protein
MSFTGLQKMSFPGLTGESISEMFMKKIILIASLLLATVLFTSCLILPDGKGGTYTYALGDDEIEYKNPDGSKTIVNQDGTVTHKR